MPDRPSIKHCATLALGALILAGCSGQKTPAEKMISDIESAISAVGPDAAKFTPDQLTEVQLKLGDLKGSYDKGDYKAVVSSAPPVISEAQGLARAAAAKKELIVKGLNEQWTSLSHAIPANLTAIQNRIDFLGKPENKKLASGVDLVEARTGLSDAEGTWSKAHAAFSQGNLDEAVGVAKTVQAKMVDLSASMKLDLSQPAAVRDTDQ